MMNSLLRPQACSLCTVTVHVLCAWEWSVSYTFNFFAYLVAVQVSNVAACLRPYDARVAGAHVRCWNVDVNGDDAHQ